MDVEVRLVADRGDDVHMLGSGCRVVQKGGENRWNVQPEALNSKGSKGSGAGQGEGRGNVMDDIRRSCLLQSLHGHAIMHSRHCGRGVCLLNCAENGHFRSLGAAFGQHWSVVELIFDHRNG